LLWWGYERKQEKLLQKQAAVSMRPYCCKQQVKLKHEYPWNMWIEWHTLNDFLFNFYC
jgi:hypothetical protein